MARRANSLDCRSACAQDVPSFLQEITTVRGQLSYASAALREENCVPPDLDVADDLAVAERDLLHPLAEMYAKSTEVREPVAAAKCASRCCGAMKVTF